MRNVLLASPLIACGLLLSGCANQPTALNAAIPGPQSSATVHITPYQARTGHARPLIVVVGDNGGTELSDFVVPYGILTESGVADVVTLSTRPGAVKTFTDMGKPGFRLQTQATLAEFDANHPEGADYVVVPALHETDELLTWLSGQAKHGAILVSICNGGMVVEETGVMQGRYATAHWSTESHRMEHHGDVHWVRNARYVADGNWVSSAGVSAALPASVALVEAIAGRERATALAQKLGVDDWSAKHDSDSFHPRLGNAWPLATVVYTNSWFNSEQAFGVPAADGVDEAALALTVDAYSSTGRSRAYLLAASDAPLKTRHGLTILPDKVQGSADAPATAITIDAQVPLGKVLDQALDGIASRYGHSTAYGVAVVLEYPGYVAR
jgi:putative intracellular protease/amidase